MVGAVLFSLSVVGSMGVGECSPTVGGKVVGEACTRTSECLSGLVCQSGICAETDAGVTDTGVTDAGTPTDASDAR